MDKKIIAFGLIIALVVSVGMASALSNSGGGDSKYYKEITLKEKSGNSLSDYQVLVELNSSNFPDKAKLDGSDLRFAEDEKEFSYWIEDYDASAKNTRIWVKVPSIPANGEAIIKMYYGNEKASSVSDGNAVFEFFDDFESGFLKPDWYATGYEGRPRSLPTASSAQSIGSYSMKFNPDDVAFIGYPEAEAIEFEFWKPYEEGVVDFYMGIYGDGSKAIYPYVDDDNSGFPVGSILYHDTTYRDTDYDYKSSSWNKIKYLNINWAEGIFDMYLGDTKIKSRANMRSVPNAEDAIEFYLHYQSSTNAYVDNFFIRKYTSPEPIISISAEYPAQKIPSITLKKSASPSTIQGGETTKMSIRVENKGSGDAENIEVTDTIPMGFKIISGSKSANFDLIKPGDYRLFEYTIKATRSGKFTCDPATSTYKDADTNSYSATSNTVSLQVGGEIPTGEDSDGDGWSNEKEKEMGTNPYSVDSDSDGLKDPEDPNPTVPDKKTPGFEAIFVITGLLAVTYLLRRGE